MEASQGQREGVVETNAEGVLGELGYDGGRLCLIMCYLLVLLRIMIPTLLSDDDPFSQPLPFAVIPVTCHYATVIAGLYSCSCDSYSCRNPITRRNAICK